MDRWDRACALCPHLWWFTLDVVYSAKRSYLWTGNTSLCRDEWIACSLNTAGVGWVGVSDIGHWVMWEWNSSADHKQQLWYAHTHQFNIDYLYLLGQSIFFLISINKMQLCIQLSKTSMHLCHDVMWPDVRSGGDVLSLRALWLWGPEQSGAEHGGQVMKGHLVDGLLLSHPAETTTNKHR